ncbi:MAG: LON peptidase substrate-binding domain-containing protein [Acidobacteria bacterium]|nr:LON peptidase substrate-binding domain-containing protein [Acidobacteriota bacterium]
MSEFLLPLFPLNVVLFPRTNLPLHIFEERYKQMVADCLENHWEFGMVLAQDRSLEQIGCTASISQITRRYEDGRLDIVVRGQRRFEVLLLDQEKPYLRGATQFFEDEAGPVPLEDSRRRRVLKLYEQVREMLPTEVRQAGGPPPELSDVQLSYQIMGSLPADLKFKQDLLESRSESDRLTEVISYLQKLAGHLSLVIKTRAKAGGNGQGR